MMSLCYDALDTRKQALLQVCRSAHHGVRQDDATGAAAAQVLQQRRCSKHSVQTPQKPTLAYLQAASSKNT